MTQIRDSRLKPRNSAPRAEQLPDRGDFDEATAVWNLSAPLEAAYGFGFEVTTRHMRPTKPWPHTQKTYEGLFSELPRDSVVQFVEHGGAQPCHDELAAWAQTRSNEAYPELLACTLSQHDYLASVNTDTGQHRVRDIRHFIFIKIPANALSVSDGAAAEALHAILMRCRRALEHANWHPVLLGRADYSRIDRALENAAAPLHQGMPGAQQSLPATTAEPSQHNERRALPLVTVAYPPSNRPFGWALAGPLGNAGPSSCAYWALATFHLASPVTTKKAINQRTGFWRRRELGVVHVSESAASCLKEPATSLWNDSLVLISTGIVLFPQPAEEQECSNLAVTQARREGYLLKSLHSSKVLPYWKPFAPWTAKDTQSPWIVRRRCEVAHLALFPGEAVLAPLKQGGVPLLTQRGRLSVFNPFHSERDFNFTVIGGAGSGKTTFARSLAVDVLLRGGKVMMLDYPAHTVTRSAFVEVTQPRVVCLDKPTGFSLNPFTALTSEQRFWDAFSSVVELIVAMMFPVTSAPEVSPQLQLIVGHAVTRAWEQHGPATELHHVQAKLLHSSEAYGAELAIRLEPYVTGDSAGFFSGPRDRYDADNFVVYSIDKRYRRDLEAPGLAQVLISAVHLACYQDAYFDESARKKLFYVASEAHLPANWRGIAYEKMLRTGKNVQLSVGTEAQCIGDLMGSFAGRLSVSLSGTRVMLRPRSETIDYLYSMGLIDDFSKDLMIQGCYNGRLHICTSSGEEGVYRQVFDPRTAAALVGNPKIRRDNEGPLAQ